MFRTLVCQLAILALSIVPFQAQTRSFALRVEIYGQSEITSSGYSLHLIDAVRRFETASAEADMTGAFRLPSVEPGDYVLRIADSFGNVVREEYVRLDGNNSLMRIQLPRSPDRARPAAVPVSLLQLRNPPSKFAIRAFREAQKHSEAGRTEQAARELQKAVDLSPHFAEAHTNLGAQYLRLRQYEKAIEQTRLALAAGSPNIYDLCNRGLAEWALGRVEDAMKSAREALRVDARAPTAHYIIGTLLSQKPQTRREGIRHLELAAESLPSAIKNLELARQELASEGR